MRYAEARREMLPEKPGNKPARLPSPTFLRIYRN